MWCSWSIKCRASQLIKKEKGNKLEVELYVSDGGKKESQFEVELDVSGPPRIDEDDPTNFDSTIRIKSKTNKSKINKSQIQINISQQETE